MGCSKAALAHGSGFRRIFTVTDELRSYSLAHRDVLPSVNHDTGH